MSYTANSDAESLGIQRDEDIKPMSIKDRIRAMNLVAERTSGKPSGISSSQLDGTACDLSTLRRKGNTGKPHGLSSDPGVGNDEEIAAAAITTWRRRRGEEKKMDNATELNDSEDEAQDDKTEWTMSDLTKGMGRQRSSSSSPSLTLKKEKSETEVTNSQTLGQPQSKRVLKEVPTMKLKSIPSFDKRNMNTSQKTIFTGRTSPVPINSSNVQQNESEKRSTSQKSIRTGRISPIPMISSSTQQNDCGFVMPKLKPVRRAPHTLALVNNVTSPQRELAGAQSNNENGSNQVGSEVVSTTLQVNEVCRNGEKSDLVKIEGRSASLSRSPKRPNHLSINQIRHASTANPSTDAGKDDGTAPLRSGRMSPIPILSSSTPQNDCGFVMPKLKPVRRAPHTLSLVNNVTSPPRESAGAQSSIENQGPEEGGNEQMSTALQMNEVGRNGDDVVQRSASLSRSPKRSNHLATNQIQHATNTDPSADTEKDDTDVPSRVLSDINNRDGGLGGQQNDLGPQKKKVGTPQRSKISDRIKAFSSGTAWKQQSPANYPVAPPANLNSANMKRHSHSTRYKPQQGEDSSCASSERQSNDDDSISVSTPMANGTPARLGAQPPTPNSYNSEAAYTSVASSGDGAVAGSVGSSQPNQASQMNYAYVGTPGSSVQDEGSATSMKDGQIIITKPLTVKNTLQSKLEYDKQKAVRRSRMIRRQVKVPSVLVAAQKKAQDQASKPQWGAHAPLETTPIRQFSVDTASKRNSAPKALDVIPKQASSPSYLDAIQKKRISTGESTPEPLGASAKPSSKPAYFDAIPKRAPKCDSTPQPTIDIAKEASATLSFDIISERTSKGDLTPKSPPGKQVSIPASFDATPKQVPKEDSTPKSLDLTLKQASTPTSFDAVPMRTSIPTSLDTAPMRTNTPTSLDGDPTMLEQLEEIASENTAGAVVEPEEIPNTSKDASISIIDDVDIKQVPDGSQSTNKPKKDSNVAGKKSGTGSGKKSQMKADVMKKIIKRRRRRKENQAGRKENSKEKEPVSNTKGDHKSHLAHNGSKETTTHEMRTKKDTSEGKVEEPPRITIKRMTNQSSTASLAGHDVENVPPLPPDIIRSTQNGAPDEDHSRLQKKSSTEVLEKVPFQHKSATNALLDDDIQAALSDVISVASSVLFDEYPDDEDEPEPVVDSFDMELSPIRTNDTSRHVFDTSYRNSPASFMKNSTTTSAFSPLSGQRRESTPRRANRHISLRNLADDQFSPRRSLLSSSSPRVRNNSPTRKLTSDPPMVPFDQSFASLRAPTTSMLRPRSVISEPNGFGYRQSVKDYPSTFRNHSSDAFSDVSSGIRSSSASSATSTVASRAKKILAERRARSKRKNETGISADTTLATNLARKIMSEGSTDKVSPTRKNAEKNMRDKEVIKEDLQGNSAVHPQDICATADDGEKPTKDFDDDVMILDDEFAQLDFKEAKRKERNELNALGNISNSEFNNMSRSRAEEFDKPSNGGDSGQVQKISHVRTNSQISLNMILGEVGTPHAVKDADHSADRSEMCDLTSSNLNDKNRNMKSTLIHDESTAGSTLDVELNSPDGSFKHSHVNDESTQSSLELDVSNLNHSLKTDPGCTQWMQMSKLSQQGINMICGADLENSLDVSTISAVRISQQVDEEVPFDEEGAIEVEYISNQSIIKATKESEDRESILMHVTHEMGAKANVQFSMSPYASSMSSEHAPNYISASSCDTSDDSSNFPMRLYCRKY